MSPGPSVLRIRLERADVAAMVREDPLLKEAPLMRALGARAESVLKNSVGLRVPHDAAVFQQGEPGDSLFFVLKGEVRVSAKAGAEQVELAVVAKADVVGETEALGSQTARCVSAVARGDAELAEIPRQVLLERGQLTLPLAQYLSQLQQRRQKALEEMSDFLGRW